MYRTYCASIEAGNVIFPFRIYKYIFINKIAEELNISVLALFVVVEKINTEESEKR